MIRKKKTHEDPICAACGLCNGTLCKNLLSEMELRYEYPKQFPQTYGGIRFTADAMDCALPIAIDSHSGCSYNCLYCFSNNLQRAADRNPKKLQNIIKNGSFYSEWPIKRLEAFLARDLKDNQSKAMYKVLDSGVPIQLGALGDPFDDLEIHSGWAKKAIPLFIKYKIPVRVGTKGGIALQKKSYLKLFEKSPEQFWFAFSIISNSDDLISRVDLRAPNTTQRLKAMNKLTEMGCKASIRFRPFLPGISDAYPGEPEAWKTLITRAKNSGAQAISFEYIFLNPVPTPKQAEMYRLMFRQMGNTDFAKEWHEASNLGETCRRGSREMKYEMTMKIKKHIESLNMALGISDPHFKEYNSNLNCCGLPDGGDKWFSKFSRKQMTAVIVEAKRSYERGEIRLFNYEDWKAEWMHESRLHTMVASGNWHNYRKKLNVTFGDHVRAKWNNPSHPRGPYKYFEKVLKPIGIDKNTGDLVYIYNEWDIDKLNKFEGIRNF